MSFEQQLISWRRELHQNPELTAGGGHHRADPRLAAERRADPAALRSENRAGRRSRQRRQGDCPAGGHRRVAHRGGDRSALPLAESRGNACLRPRYSHQRDAGGGAAAEGAGSGTPGAGADPVSAGGGKFWRGENLIRAGALEEVSAIFGMHNEPGLPVGELPPAAARSTPTSTASSSK